MADTEDLSYAGGVIIDQVQLTSANGKSTVDIRGFMVELDIFEDLYSPCCSGTITITENFNLIANFPIVGEEVLSISYHTPTSDVSVNKTFAVIKVSDRTYDSVVKSTYVLKFVSLEAIKDLTTKVYRAYEGTPSEIASSIATSALGVNLNVTTSSNVIKFVCPTVSPFRALSMLANKAFDSSPQSMNNFLFYEDSQGYNFKSLSSLYRIKPVSTLRYSASRLRQHTQDGESVKSFNDEYANVKSFKLTHSVDTLERRMLGAYGHKVIEVDILRKRGKYRLYDVMTDFPNQAHLNEYAPFTNILVSSVDSVVEVAYTSPRSHDNIKVDMDGEVLTNRTPSLAQQEMIRAELVCHGHTMMKVGDTILLELPKAQSSDMSDLNNTNDIDPHYSGKWIITAIQNRLTLNKHEMVMSIAKDSFNSVIKSGFEE